MREPFLLNTGHQDRVIRGEVKAPDVLKPYPTIILVHGFKGFKDWGFFPVLQDHLVKNGLSTVSFNFSMCGVEEDLMNFTNLDKFAHLTYRSEQEDLSTVLSYLRKKELPLAEALDTNLIGLFGHSRGGGNSILFALDNPTIKAVAVWNSIHRVDFFGEALIEEIKKNGIGYIDNARTNQKMPIHKEVLEDIEENREKYHILHRLKELAQPLLLLQGNQDYTSLVEGALTMAAASPHASFHMIKDADHTMGMKHPFIGSNPQFEEATQLTTHFFLHHLTKKAPR